MLTTEKWGALSSPRRACLPARRPLSTSDAGCRRLAIWWLLVLPLLFTACEPPGPAALRKGRQLILAGRPADAVEPLKRAIRLLGTNDVAVAQAWNHLGLAYHYAGQSEDALGAYQAALGKDFNLFAARYNRGALFLELNNLPAAINELTTYTTHEPGNPDGWLKLGIALLRARQYEPADRALQRVLTLPAPPAVQAEALNNLGVSHAQRRRTREAFQFFNAALKAQTNYAPAILNQAVVAQQQLGDRRLALGRYRAYLELAPPGPAREEVRALADALEAALNPPVLVAAPPVPLTNPPAVTEALSNLTELLTRTAAVAVVVPPATNRVAEPTSPPPAAVTGQPSPPQTSAPAPVVVVTTQRFTAPPRPVITQVPPTVVGGPTPLPRDDAATAPARPPAALPPAAVRPREAARPEPPPTEVVELEPEPEFKPARDIVAVPPASAAPAARPLVRPIGSDRAEEEKEKKSLVSRLNPLGWFGGSDEDADRKAREKAEKEAAKEAKKREKQRTAAATPIPNRPTGEMTPPPAVPRAAELAAPAPVVPAPSFPRYRYVNPAPPSESNRAAARAPFEEGLRAQQAKRLNEAIAAYRRAVALAPGYFDAWFNLGVVAALNGDLPTALEAGERALAIQPGDPNARFNFALALQAAGYPLDAIDELGTVLTTKPDFADAHLTLGGIYADQLKDVPRARAHYQKVLELSPRHPNAAEVRRWLAAHRSP
jgi:tetratricopeptide (TPR) repeat protein